jgi:1-acyl-sn-glycerol-3-phosphate acyltransferase
VVAEILDPIPPGLGKEAFFERLQSDIESATVRLIAEGRAKMGR